MKLIICDTGHEGINAVAAIRQNQKKLRSSSGRRRSSARPLLDESWRLISEQNAEVNKTMSANRKIDWTFNKLSYLFTSRDFNSPPFLGWNNQILQELKNVLLLRGEILYQSMRPQ